MNPWILAGLLLAASATAQTLPSAAMDDNLAVVRLLLKQGADVNSAQGDGTTALHWAAIRNDLEIGRLLIRSGANVNAATRIGGLTPLFLAATAGNAEMISELLKAGASAKATNSVNGTTPLMKAAASGSVDAVKLVLDHGADPNAKEAGLDQTAIMFAAASDRAGVVTLLAARGASLKLTSKVTQIQPQKDLDSDDFPLDADLILHANLPPGKAAAAALAGRRASPTVSGGLTALLLAARDGRLAATRALLDAGAAVNQPSAGDNSTPLVMAIINGHFDTAKLLLDHGADPNLANQDGLAPLYATIDAQWAPIAGGPVPLTAHEKTTYLDLMKALLEHGADPNARLGRKLWFRPLFHDQMWIGTPGSTAFWRAAQATDLAAMRLLVEHRADAKIASEEGDTALMLAAGVGWAGNFTRVSWTTSALDAVRYCLELGLDVNAQDVTGYTALMGAAWRGDDDLIKLLIERGARLDPRTHRGWSATDMATGPYLRTTGATPHPGTIALLLKLGAPPLTPHPHEDILGLATPASK